MPRDDDDDGFALPDADMEEGLDPLPPLAVFGPQLPANYPIVNLAVATQENALFMHQSLQVFFDLQQQVRELKHTVGVLLDTTETLLLLVQDNAPPAAAAPPAAPAPLPQVHDLDGDEDDDDEDGDDDDDDASSSQASGGGSPKKRRLFTPEMEGALLAAVDTVPRSKKTGRYQWKKILKYDVDEGEGLLEQWRPCDLKDKFALLMGLKNKGGSK